MLLEKITSQINCWSHVLSLAAKSTRCWGLHWKLDYAARYAKFILRHTWCIKQKNRKHTLCINSFYLRTFSKKTRSSFFGLSGSFFARGICKSFLFGSPFFEIASYAPILWIFLSSLFFLKLACSLFKKFLPRFLYFSIRYVHSTKYMCILPHHTVIWGCDFHFSSSTFSLHDITTKHTKSSHDGGILAWYDGMIDSTFHQNREGGKRSSSSSYDWEVPHQSYVPSLFCFASLLLILILQLQWGGYRTII